MLCPLTAFYGGVVTPIDPRHWKAMPKCLLVLGPTGDIVWMNEHMDIDTAGDEITIETLKGRWTITLVRLREGEFIIPGFIDTHTVRVSSAGSQLSLIKCRLPACTTIP